MSSFGWAIILPHFSHLETYGSYMEMKTLTLGS
jgi:hypothetical protein